MNFKSFALMLCFAPVLCGAEHVVINQSFVPDKTNRAYTVMVEAGAKLLEFDIIRARVNAQEKALVADLQKEQYTSTAGKALGVLGPLEQLAHGFDDVIPAFLILQNSVTESATTDAVKTQISKALNGLVALLAAPEVLHAVLPQPELVGAQYRDAMTYAPTATFIKTIQAIAHKKFMLHYCSEDQQLVGQQVLPNDAHLFYGVIRQTVQNLFGEMMKAVTVGSVVMDHQAENSRSQGANHCAVLYFDWNKVCESYVEFSNAKKHFEKTNDSKEWSASIPAITQKMHKAFESIAKKRNANSGIASTNHPAYVNPECDVTQEVIDLLNKEYLASKQNDVVSEKPEQQESVVKVEVKKPVEQVQTAKPNLSPQEMLHQAILHDSAQEVEAAVKAGASMQMELTHFGYGQPISDSPIIYAVKLGRSRAVNALLKLGAQSTGSLIASCSPHWQQREAFSCESYPLVMYSMLIGDVESALALIKNGANFAGNPPHSNYYETWGERIMKRAIELVDQDQATCLQLIQELLNHGYKINETEHIKNPLYFAIVGGGQSVAVPNKPKDTSIVIDLLVKNGADINHAIHFPWYSLPPLFIAIQEFNKKAVEFLLNSHANVNLQAYPEPEKRGHGPAHTALSYAIKKCQEVATSHEMSVIAHEIVELIKQHGGGMPSECCS